MTTPDDMPIDRLRKGWLCTYGNRHTVLYIAFAKAVIEREESPQEAARMLDELLKSAPGHIVKAIPALSDAAVRKLDPAEGKQIVVDDETRQVPLHPEAFRLLTGTLFWDLCAMTPGTIDALIEIEDAQRPQQIVPAC